MNIARSSLPRQLLIALFLGVATGLFFGEYCESLRVVGQAFIMLLKMTILPYMSIALIHALGELTPGTALTMLKRILTFLLLLWTTTLITIYCLTLVFPSDSIPSTFAALTGPREAPPDLLSLFIPVNPFHAIANDVVPAVVVFSIFFGAALMRMPRKMRLLDHLSTILQALVKITQWIVLISPIGIFAIIAVKVGTMSLGQFDQIRLYLDVYIAGALFLSLWMFPRLVALITPVKHHEFIRELRTPFLISFTTANNLIILPLVMQAVERLGHRHGLDKRMTNDTVESAVPIAYNFPTAGNLFAILYILFLSFFYGRSLDFFDHLTLNTLSFPVLFGSANSVILAVSFLIDRLHLPLDGYALYIQTMPLTRNFQTLLSAVEISALTVLVTFSTQRRASIQWRRLAISVIGTLIVGALILGVAVLVRAKTRQHTPVFSRMELALPEKTIIHHPGEPRPSPRPTGTLADIRERGVLRVGYNSQNMPYTYLNRQGNLVGHDTSFAVELATDLGVRLELIPFEYGQVIDDIEEGVFDIGITSISVTPERLLRVRFSEPYTESNRALVVLDHRRQQFRDLAKLQADTGFTIAYTVKSSTELTVRHLFPLATRVPMGHIDEFLGETEIDAYAWTVEQGAPWTLLHPDYTVVRTAPPMGREYYAFAMHNDSSELQEYVNYWLLLKELDGFTERQHKKWILGLDDRPQKRWSIIKDVFHWVE
ncbi:Uncharacterized protein SCG7086_AB_00200 [Chlamydiales bacterium SCGC AG-110-P3]|nr:Uncharacterized protein SCG7086_AB_00200 [Chlamydiales bacterium SCGC AG-110-P3]